MKHAIITLSLIMLTNGFTATQANAAPTAEEKCTAAQVLLTQSNAIIEKATAAIKAEEVKKTANAEAYKKYGDASYQKAQKLTAISKNNTNIAVAKRAGRPTKEFETNIATLQARIAELDPILTANKAGYDSYNAAHTAISTYTGAINNAKFDINTATKDINAFCNQGRQSMRNPPGVMLWGTSTSFIKM